MVDVSERKLIMIWAALIGITLVSWEFIDATRSIHPILPAVLLMTLAFVKVRFVILDFMEVRHALIGLRVALEVWIAMACVAIIGLLWLKH